MSERTPNLQLPYILSNQAQKHVTHNEAIRNLDALVQMSLEDKDLATAPATPTDGARYIVATGATGAWAGHENMIASWQDGAWHFYIPEEGWVVWIKDEDIQMVYDGTQWQSLSSGGGGGSISLNPATGGLVGVNATADTTNRLSVTSPASLFNHDGDDHQLKINKNSLTDNASVLFQSSFSGRAEFGLTGDDDFHMKVSPDGTTFHEAIMIDKDNGAVSHKESSKFSAYVNFDRYIAANTWSLIDNNNARHNDQGDWSAGIFTAPAEGYYLFGAGYRFKANGTVPTDIQVGLSINDAVPTADRVATSGDATIVTLQSFVQINSLIKLSGSDTVRAKAYMTTNDGYVEANSNFFWGCRVA